MSRYLAIGFAAGMLALLLAWALSLANQPQPRTLPDVAAVAARVRPATVMIVRLQRGETTPVPTPTVMPRRPRLLPHGAGTGFIYDPAGYIITNAHVVEGADRLRVLLPPPSNQYYDGVVVGLDRQRDLALVKIDGQRLPTIALGRSADLRVGDWVMAMGNALALAGGPTATIGIISALERSSTAPFASDDTATTITLHDLIQTDATINPGNSGGPLVNLSGEVVGITTLISNDGRDIGYAIAIDEALPIINNIRQTAAIQGSGEDDTAAPTSRGPALHQAP